MKTSSNGSFISRPFGQIDITKNNLHFLKIIDKTQHYIKNNGFDKSYQSLFWFVFNLKNNKINIIIYNTKQHNKKLI
jgi:hypothetical protein